MTSGRHHVVAMAIGVGLAAGWPAVMAPPGSPSAEEGQRQVAVDLLDRMPLLFVPEQWSPDGEGGFAVRGREAGLWLGDTGLAYRLHGTGDNETQENAGGWVVALDLVGAEPRRPVGGDPLPTRVNYFKGPRERWRAGLPSYGSVAYREPWPGVDLVVSGTSGELKSTFVVRPGADPGQIRLAYRGATEVRLEPDGSLVVDTPLGEIREGAPFAYQEVDGRRVEVVATFELETSSEPGRQAYRFRLGEYDPTRELVVDPVTLVYCGYIGGSGGEGGVVAVDGAGNAYVYGTTDSTDASFPVTVGPDVTHNGGEDAFVARVSADGSGLDYCGYIGGSGTDKAGGIAVDGAGNAYVTGYTNSTEETFPVTVGPDVTYNGGNWDAFVAKVNADGANLEYCGYIGGSEGDQAGGIAVDGAGNAYVTGQTWSTETTFPVTVGPDLTYNDANVCCLDVFVAKVTADGTGLDYCGYIGGDRSEHMGGVAVDGAGNAYVTGGTSSDEASFPVTVGPDLTHNGEGDSFVAKVTADGTGLDYCGYIGGDRSEHMGGVAVDGAGNAYVTGGTLSDEASFPVTVGPDLTYNGGEFDAFVAKVNADGTRLDYCGYIGGSKTERPGGIAVDGAGNAYVTGDTDSTEASFPVTVGPDVTYNGGERDSFVARVNADGTGLDSCGYIGGSGDEWGGGIAVDAAGNAYVSGSTDSTEASFPVTVGPDLTHNGWRDAFIAKLRFPGAPLTYRSIVPAAALAAGAEGAFFQTDLEVNNKGAAPATVAFQWLPRSRDNSEPLESDPVALGPGRSARYENVLASVFGLEPDAVGALAVIADSPDVIGMSRTYNLPGAKAAGTFGQGLPAIRASEMITGTEPRRIIFLSEDTDSRANVGCVNGTGGRVRITIAIFDAEGTPLDTRTMNLGPYSNNQINRVLGGWQPVNGQVEVWADSADARYYCYGSMLDNQTSDPTTILPQASSDSLTFIPAAALAAGLEGAFFRTDVDLNNAGPADITYELAWLPRRADNSDPTRSRLFSLAPGAGVRYSNVLEEVFGLEPDQVGGLAVDASGSDLLAMSRTYNLPSAEVAGTFGQELPGIPADRMIPVGVKKRIIFMNETDEVRSNVGCQNASLEPATVNVELHDSDGERLGTKTMSLPPLSNDQITRVFRDFAPIAAGYVDVWTGTEGASIYCYGSALDNQTSDPTTVLPQ